MGKGLRELLVRKKKRWRRLRLPASPQGSRLMRNTLLEAQYLHVNLITPFLGVAAFCSELGCFFPQLTNVTGAFSFTLASKD
jgi:hypothetical protein